ncbi:MAG TPA: hypothetical protein VG733_02925, partial [Chthoniobacteraceae bacterium]|nr:hypothetical protein [Chthoniobacteraceae bacterium]
MSEIPPDFDLKFLPDWLKEQPKKNAYADYEGETEERPRRDFTKPRPRKPEQRGRPGEQRSGGQRRAEGKHGRREGGGRDDRSRGPAAPAPMVERRPEKPLAVKVEFLPELHCAAALAKQIKASTRAYPLFDLARMFLGKPDRHRVKITTSDASLTLHQCGENGPVALDRATLERNAFPLAKQLYYTEETTQGEPPKGNYSNVARCRLSGTLLGPTNYHGYQPALRRLYEERFSRRMPFSDFQREIEVVSDPAVVEQWKDQARSVTTYKTLNEAEPVTFTSASEAEGHFRANYLPQIMKSGNAFELSGEASRNLPDRQLAGAVRYAWEEENRFPGHLMNHLRHEFIHAGLYIFKHRNRIQLVSAIRPVPFTGNLESLSNSVAEILKVIAATQKCTRAELAAKVLPAHQEDPAKAKSQLASDLHWLTHAGHVIELHNGILELPTTPAA